MSTNNRKKYYTEEVNCFLLVKEDQYKLTIDLALLKYFKGNFTKTAMLSCYAHMFKKHKLTPFVCEDSYLANLYEKTTNCIEKNKKELKEEGFITTERKGLDPRKYISVNMEKVFEIYKNFGDQKSSEFFSDSKTKNSWLKKLEEESWIKKQGYEYICFNNQQEGGK